MRAPVRTRRHPWIALAAILTLILAGCGAKIDTLLTVDTVGKGSRVMTLSLDKEDLENVEGSVEDIDASINTHLPEQLEYAGITEEGETLTTSFTMTFEDADDYRDQVQQLLNAGDIAWSDDNLTFNTSTDKFSSGVTLIETFSSADLLTWLFNGLASDGIISASDQSSAWEMGETTVEYNGVEYESLDRVSLDKRVDNGFIKADSEITFTEGGFHREITFGITSKAQYTSNAELYDEHFAELESAGATVTKDDSSAGVSWTVAFDAANAEELVDMTNKVLSSEESAFSVETVFADGALKTNVSSYAECSAICAEELQVMTEKINPPADSHEAEIEQPAMGSYYPGEPLTTTFTTELPLEDVSMTFTIDPEGPASSIFRFSLPSTTIAGMTQAIADSLVQGGGGDVNSEEMEDNTVFSVKIEGETIDDFNAKYSTWADMPVDVSVIDVSDQEWGGDYQIMGSLPTPAFFISGSIPVAGEVHVDGNYTINESIPPSPQAGEDGTTLTGTFDATGLNFDFVVDKKSSALLWILLGGALLLLIILAAIILLARKRKKGGQEQAMYAAPPAGPPSAEGLSNDSFGPQNHMPGPGHMPQPAPEQAPEHPSGQAPGQPPQDTIHDGGHDQAAMPPIVPPEGKDDHDHPAHQPHQADDQSGTDWQEPMKTREIQVDPPAPTAGQEPDTPEAPDAEQADEAPQDTDED